MKFVVFGLSSNTSGQLSFSEFVNLFSLDKQKKLIVENEKKTQELAEKIYTNNKIPHGIIVKKLDSYTLSWLFEDHVSRIISHRIMNILTSAYSQSQVVQVNMELKSVCLFMSKGMLINTTTQNFQIKDSSVPALNSDKGTKILDVTTIEGEIGSTFVPGHKVIVDLHIDGDKLSLFTITPSPLYYEAFKNLDRCLYISDKNDMDLVFALLVFLDTGYLHENPPELEIGFSYNFVNIGKKISVSKLKTTKKYTTDTPEVVKSIYNSWFVNNS